MLWWMLRSNPPVDTRCLASASLRIWLTGSRRRPPPPCPPIRRSRHAAAPLRHPHAYCCQLWCGAEGGGEQRRGSEERVGRGCCCSAPRCHPPRVARVLVHAASCLCRLVPPSPSPSFLPYRHQPDAHGRAGAGAVCGVQPAAAHCQDLQPGVAAGLRGGQGGLPPLPLLLLAGACSSCSCC